MLPGRAQSLLWNPGSAGSFTAHLFYSFDEGEGSPLDCHQSRKNYGACAMSFADYVAV
jgi:hypothetical protein